MIVSSTSLFLATSSFRESRTFPEIRKVRRSA